MPDWFIRVMWSLTRWIPFIEINPLKDTSSVMYCYPLFLDHMRPNFSVEYSSYPSTIFVDRRIVNTAINFLQGIWSTSRTDGVGAYPYLHWHRLWCLYHWSGGLLSSSRNDLYHSPHKTLLNLEFIKIWYKIRNIVGGRCHWRLVQNWDFWKDFRVKI